MPRPDEILDGGADDASPEVIVACTSPRSVKLAAERGAADAARDALRRRGEGRDGRPVAQRGAARRGTRRRWCAGAGHVSAGVAQIADRRTEAAETLLKSMPGWLKQGLEAHVTVDGRHRAMRDPVAYTELLCGLHPVGTVRDCPRTASPPPPSARASPASPCSSRARAIWRPRRRTSGGWGRRCCRCSASRADPAGAAPSGHRPASVAPPATRSGSEDRQQSRSSGDWLRS